MLWFVIIIIPSHHFHFIFVIFFFLLLYAYPRLLRPSLFRNAALIFHFPTELVDLEMTDCTKTSGRGKVGLGPGGGGHSEESIVVLERSEMHAQHDTLTPLRGCGYLYCSVVHTVRPLSSQATGLWYSAGRGMASFLYATFFFLLSALFSATDAWRWHRSAGALLSNI